MKQAVYDEYGNYLGEIETDRGCGCWSLFVAFCMLCACCGSLFQG